MDVFFGEMLRKPFWQCCKCAGIRNTICGVVESGLLAELQCKDYLSGRQPSRLCKRHNLPVTF